MSPSDRCIAAVCALLTVVFAARYHTLYPSFHLAGLQCARAMEKDLAMARLYLSTASAAGGCSAP